MDPDTTQQAIFQYNLVSNITSLAALGASLAAIIRSFKRNPPLSETMLKDFATKEDIRELKREFEKHRGDMTAQLRSGDKCFKDLERVIGRLETLFEMCPYMCRKEPK